MLRYAMSLDVCTTVSGIDSIRVLRQNIRIASGFSPMSATARAKYERSLLDAAPDGRFELYKTSAEHEGEVGRVQHGMCASWLRRARDSPPTVPRVPCRVHWPLRHIARVR